MENNMLDVTIAVQSLRDYVEKVGKRDVKMAGYQNAVVSSVKLGNGNIKSIKDELGNLLGFDITNYTLDEICNKVLDKAADLSSDWKYQFEYRFVPNIKKPTFILFTIWNKINNYANEIKEYKSLEEKGEKQMVEKKRTRSSSDYTDEEMDFMQKLYAGKVDAAEKFYREKEAKQEMPLQRKYQLEEYFKAKYPKYENKKPGNIWQAFYNKRILPRKKDVLQLFVVENEVTQELDTVDTAMVTVEYNDVPEEQPKYSHIPLSDYVEKVRTYIINVGVGEHKSVAIDFINSVFNTGSYVNSKTIASFAKVLRKSLTLLNEDEEFEYISSYSMSKIDKQSNDNSAKNMELTITCKIKDVKQAEEVIEEPVEEVIEEPVEDLGITNVFVEEDENTETVQSIIDSCIDKHKIYKHYTVSLLLGYYYKRRFRKNKFLGVRSIRLEMIIDGENTEEELDKEVRKNVELAVKPINPDDKLEVKLEPVDGRDYTIILSKEIVV